MRSWRTDTTEILKAVSFSPDGRLLATGGSGEDVVKLWDVATGEEVTHFKGHNGGIASVAFSLDGRTLASGGGEASVLLWDVTGRHGKANRPLTPRRLQELWNVLAQADVKKAHAATWELALSPDGAVPFLRERIAPVKPADAARVGRLVKQLDADDFATRQAATRQLEVLGGSAIPALRQALAARPSLEVTRRIEAILASYFASEEWARCRRALAVLEYGGSALARKLVEDLARGAPGAPLTEEARAVVERHRRARR